jgi:hypothetical protein
MKERKERVMLKARSGKQASQTQGHIRPAKRERDSVEVTNPVPRDAYLMDELHARITARAYELYAERGYREGYAEQDWLDAEREILNRISQS